MTECDLVHSTLQLNRYIERFSIQRIEKQSGGGGLEREGKRTHFGLEKGMRLMRRKRLYEKEATGKCERDRAHTYAGRAHMRAPGARVDDCARAHGRAAGRCFRLLSMTPISHKVGDGGLGEEQKKASARVAGTWARSAAFSWLSNSNSWEGTAQHHQLLARALCRRTPSFCLSVSA